jgi:drug/metabolite transporter (DMT)-like permease
VTRSQSGGNAAAPAGPGILLLIGVLSIAWSVIFVRWTHTPGTISAFYRVLIADVATVPLLIWRRQPWPALDRKTWLLGILGGIFFAADLALYNTAALRNAAGTVSLLGNSAPLFVGLLSWLVLKHRPGSRFWIGLAIALCGSATVVLGDRSKSLSFGVADGMALTSACCFAVYLIATERLRISLDTLPLLTLSLTTSAATLAVAGLAQGFSFRVPSPTAWLAMLGLGLICQLLGYLALTRALGLLPATITSVSLLAQAPLTALLALLLFAERLRGPQLLGGALVLSGVWVVTSEASARPSESAVSDER